MFYQSQRNVTKSVIKETIIPIWIRAFLSPLIWLKNIVFYLSGFLSVTVIGIDFLYLNEMGDGDTLVRLNVEWFCCGVTSTERSGTTALLKTVGWFINPLFLLTCKCRQLGKKKKTADEAESTALITEIQLQPQTSSHYQIAVLKKRSRVKTFSQMCFWTLKTFSPHN